MGDPGKGQGRDYGDMRGMIRDLEDLGAWGGGNVPVGVYDVKPDLVAAAGGEAVVEAVVVVGTAAGAVVGVAVVGPVEVAEAFGAERLKKQQLWAER